VVSFRLFQPLCHHHNLPRIQTRVGGGFFLRSFQHVCHHHLPRVQMRRRWFFSVVSNTSATTTSLASKQTRAGGGLFWLFQRICHRHHLASKCEPEVDIWCVSTSGGILLAVSTTTGRCETYTPPRSNVFPALRGSWDGM